jgi:hypothetical protein
LPLSILITFSGWCSRLIAGDAVRDRGVAGLLFVVLDGLVGRRPFETVRKRWLSAGQGWTLPMAGAATLVVAGALGVGRTAITMPVTAAQGRNSSEP